MRRVLIVAALASGVMVEGRPARQPPPLLQPADITIAGVYQVPAGFEYGGYGLTFASSTNCIYLTDFIDNQSTAELCGLNQPLGSTLTIQQPEADAYGGLMSQVDPTGASKLAGGMHTFSGVLYMTAYEYYDADFSAVASHFRRPVTLAGGTVEGPWAVGSVGFTSGYMSDVPAAWQAALGGYAVTGNCCLSIIGRTSYGPALYTFDPVSMSSTANPLVVYDQNHTTLGAWGVQPAGHTVFNVATRVTGVALIPGTSTAIFTGSTGLGADCYGTGAECNDPTSPSQGSHAYPYRVWAWLYDLNDLAQVAAGTLNPWDPVPYAEFDLGYDARWSDVGTSGAAYDAAIGRLYMARQCSAINCSPTILAFDVAAPSVPPPPAGDTTDPTVSMTAPADGADLSGTVAVTATASDDTGVVGVQFRVDAGNLGAEDLSAPYAISWDTTTIANGAHTLSAVARDAAGNTATAASVAVTVRNGTPTLLQVRPQAASGLSGATLASLPTAGNLLKVTAGVRVGEEQGYVGAPPTLSGSGWTLQIHCPTLLDDGGARRGLAVWTKTAEASEPQAVTVAWQGGVATPHVLVEEIEGTPGPLVGATCVDNGTAMDSTQMAVGPLPLPIDAWVTGSLAVREGPAGNSVGGWSDLVEPLGVSQGAFGVLLSSAFGFAPATPGFSSTATISGSNSGMTGALVAFEDVTASPPPPPPPPPPPEDDVDTRLAALEAAVADLQARVATVEGLIAALPPPFDPSALQAQIAAIKAGLAQAAQ